LGQPLLGTPRFMTVNTFFQAAEVWVPDPVDACLRLAGGSYGPHAEFRDVSVHRRFARGEGLPGRIWETGRPWVLSHFRDGSGFQRFEAAKNCKLAAGIGIPVVRRRRIHAVFVLLFGDPTDMPGITEVWAPASHGEHLRLQSGHFGDFDAFRRLSSAVTFEPGLGLPGRVWKAQTPEIWPDVSRDESFIRAAAAASYDLTTGLAWPCDERSASVAVMLSSRRIPLARAVEVWAPNASGALALTAAVYTNADHLRLQPGSTLSGSADGFIARAQAEGFPTLLGRPEDLDAKRVAGAYAAQITRGIAMPVWNNERVTSVVTLMT
jgi:hypothetical protein